MKKSYLAVFLMTLGVGCLLGGCVKNTDGTSPNESMNASGTPSPLDTNKNPWNNVNPQIQAQQQVARQQAMHAK